MKEILEQNKFGSVIKEIRENRNLSIRGLASLCEFSAAYVSDLETNKRNPTLKVIKHMSENLKLTENEHKMMMDAFAHDRLQIPVHLLYYVIDNDLIESLKVLKEVDEDGQNIKHLALSLNKNKGAK